MIVITSKMNESFIFYYFTHNYSEKSSDKFHVKKKSSTKF